MTTKGNALLIHGGGLVDPSKVVLMRLANNLAENKVYDKVFIGKYSFDALYTPELWFEYNWLLVEYVKDKRGTFFGTSRGSDLTDPVLSEKAISCLKERNVTTVIVAGGDGSSRQVAEISDTFMKEGINFIFAIPLTIDGINGGDSVGMKQAVRESVRQIENIVSTSLETKDKDGFGVVVVELQGRNRDDIMANVLKTFCSKRRVADCDFSDLLLRVVPANLETVEELLIEEINQSSKRTLVLISEGATLKKANLNKEIKRKVRSLTVGYSSQSNGMTTKTDEHEYGLWIDQITKFIAETPHECFTVVRQGCCYNRESIDYFAVRNPRKGQIAELDDSLRVLLREYMCSKTP